MTGFQPTTPVTQEELQRFDHAFRQVNREPMNEVADGRYSVCVESVSLTRASTGSPMIVWKLRIVGLVCTNRILWKRRTITDKTIPFLKEDLEICGLHLAQLSDLPREMNRMVSMEVEATKRTKNGNVDIYLSRPRAMAAAASAGRGVEEDLPF